MIIMRYFFHVRDGDDCIHDLEGSEHPDAEAARVEAVDAARELMASAIRNGRDISGQEFEIADEGSHIVMRMPFTEAIRVVT